MATAVAEAFVTLRPDMDRFEHEARAGVGASLIGVAKAATAAFSVAGVAAAAFGIKAAASFQQTTIAFEGILGDTVKAKNLLLDLRNFANVTPFQFKGLAESAQQLLAVGFNAEQIIPTMKTLGNVAATLGVGEAEIAGVVRALGQMKGKGKAMAQELNQISEQIPGFSAINVLAKSLGITTAEAFDQMEKGAISADVAITAILQGMETFPGAAGAMERQSKTLNGVLSTLKDVVTGMAIDFITPYLPAFAAGVQTFSGWLQKSAVPALQAFVDIIVRDVIPAVVAIGQWIVDHRPILIGLGVAVGTFLVAAFVALAASIVAATYTFVAAGAVIAGLTAAVIYAYENWGWFRTAVDAVGRFLRDDFIPILQKVADIVGPILTVAIQWLRWEWETAWAAIHGAVKIAWDIIEPILQSMKSTLDAVIGPLKTVTGFAGKAGGFLGGAVDRFTPFGANGFRNFLGGPAVINEHRGGELVDLPRGSNVYSMSDTNEIAGLLRMLLNATERQTSTQVRLART